MRQLGNGGSRSYPVERQIDEQKLAIESCICSNQGKQAIC